MSRAAVVEKLESRQLLSVNSTVTTIGASLEKINSGQTETLTATISSSGGTVSVGTVQFYDGTTALGSPVNVSNGTATFATTTLPIGADVISGVYSGGGSFAGSSSNLSPSSIIQTVAGTGTKGESGDNGAATAAELSNPLDVAIDSAGNLFIMDWGAAVIREVNATTHVITTVAGNGTAGYSGDNGAATAAELNHPTAITFDASDDLFIADQDNNVIREVNATTHMITTFAGNGTAGYSGDNGAATAAEFNNPTDIKFDASGNMFIADQSNSVVREVNATTHVITTVAGNGTVGSSGDNGPATAAELDGVVAIALDSAGVLYIADNYSGIVQEVNATTHVITTVAGNRTHGYSGDNGPATSAQLYYTGYLAVDASGNLFISDAFNNAIREVNATTNVITTLAGNGTGGYQGDNGAASSAEISSPQGIAFDSSGDLFFADSDNEVVREVSTGNVTINVSSSSPVPTTTVVGASDASLLTGQTETLTATVSSSGGTISSGTVQFYDGTTALGSPVNVSNGTAVYMTTTLPIGADVISAVYSGGGSFAGSSSVLSPSSIIETVAGNSTAGYSGDNGPATSAELHFPDQIAADSAGDLFITDYFNGVVREVNATTHVITTVAGQFGTAGDTGDNGPATAAGLVSPSGLAIDSAGNLFIGEENSNVVREVNATTHVITTVVGTGIAGYTGDNGAASLAELNSPVDLAVNAAGDLFIADYRNNVIREVNATTHVITTVAGNGTNGYTGNNGAATLAKLNFPIEIAVDSAGNLYYADSGDNVIREVNATTQVITTVAGSGTRGYAGDNGAATNASMNQPDGLAIDSFGDLFIADWANSVVREVNATTHVITTVAGDTSGGINGDNGAASAAGVDLPGNLSINSAGNLFIAESSDNVVREVFTGNVTINVSSIPTTTVVSTSGASVLPGQSETLTATVSSSSGTVNAGTVQFYDGSTALGNPANVINGTAVYSTSTLPIGVNVITAVYSGGGSFAGSSTVLSPSSVIQTVAGNHAQGYSGDNGAATSAEISVPNGVATDSAGDLFIADLGNSVIRAVNATTHVITTVAGNGTAGYSGDNGAATSAELDEPTGVAIDSFGDLFIADPGKNVIREVNATTHVITTVAGNGTLGYSGDNGAATAAEMSDPNNVAIDSAGDLFIADFGDSVIREVNATTHVITTVAGNGQFGYSGDNGAATAAELYSPSGIAIDSAGDLFIADYQNNVIREVNATTHVITTVAGNGTVGYSGDNGAATSAELDAPNDIAFDSAGDLFIADTTNNVIREVNATTHVITTIAGNGFAAGLRGGGYSGDNGAASAAEMFSPFDITLDSAGDLFIADTYNQVIREVASGGALVTVTVTQPPVSSGTTVPTSLTVLQNAATASLGLAGVAFTNGGGSDQSSETLTYAVTALPASSFGTVYLSNGTTAVTTGNYTLAQIDGMEFKPALNANNADASGPQSFTFTVDNGGTSTGGGVNTLTETVSIGITPVTQAPVMTAGTIAPLTVLQNAAITSLGLAGVTFGPGGGSDQTNDVLTYAVTAIPSSSFGTVYLSDGTTAVTAGAYTLAQIDGMEIKPALNANNADASGPQSLKFTVDNSGSSSNGGVNTITETVSIGITPVTQPPVLTAGSVAPLTVLQNASITSLGLTGATFGPGGGSDQSNEVLTYAITAVPSLTFGTIYLSNGTTAVAAGTYTLAQIDGMEFKPTHNANNANASGPQLLKFTVDNGGSSSNGGVNTVTETVSIGITPVTQPPVLTAGTIAPLTVLQNASMTSLGLTGVTFGPGGGSDQSNEVLTYAITAVPSSPFGTVYLSNGTTAVTAGSYTLAQIDGMEFKPALNANNADASGPQSFKFTVNNGGSSSNGGVNTVTETMSIGITPVIQPPVLTTGTFAPLTVLQNTAIKSLGLTGVTFGPGGGSDQSNEVLTYAITAVPSLTFGTVYLSNGTTAVTAGTYTLAQIDGMEFKPAHNANNANASGPQLLKFTVDNSGSSSHGGVNTVTETVSIGITPVTQPPVLTAGTIAPLTVVNYTTPTSLGLTGVTFGPGGDSDQSNDLLTYAVTAIPSSSFGTIYLSNGTTAVTTGTYTLAQIDGMEFKPVLGTGNSSASSPQPFIFSVNNGGSNSNGGVNSLTETVSIGMFALSGLTASQTYTKGSAPLAIASNLAIADSAGIHISGATITITNWNKNEDRLTFYNSAALANSLVVNTNTNTATLTLTGTASAAAYQTELRSLVYQDVNFNSPILTARNVEIVLSSSSSVSTSAATSITVHNVNLSPVVSGIETTPLAYAANSTSLPISATLLIKDDDTTNLSSATVKITSGYQNNAGGHDVLSFANQFGITGSFDATTGTLTLTGNVAVGYYRLALRSVTFGSSGTAVSAASRTLTITATDTNSVSSQAVTRQVTVSVSPALSGVSATQTFVKGSPPMPIAANLLLSDAAGLTVSSATVAITNWNSNEDRLTFINSAALVHTLNVNNATNTAILTLTGNASAAAYQTELRSLKYQDVDFNSPVLAARNFTIAFIDSASNNTSVTTSISVQNVNLPPVLSAIETTPLAYTANGVPVSISATILASDPDTTNLVSATVKITSGYQNNSGGTDVLSFVNQNGITGSFDATTGTLTLTGNVAVGYYRLALRSVKFASTGTSVSTATRTLTLTATDTNNVASTPITRTVTVSP